MKVLKNGTDKVYKYTCSNCKSDLEYTDADTFYMEEVHRGGCETTIEHIFKPDEHYHSIAIHRYNCLKCPVCGHISKRLDFSRGKPIETVGWEKVI